jgi:hypothetical protein
VVAVFSLFFCTAAFADEIGFNARFRFRNPDSFCGDGYPGRICDHGNFRHNRWVFYHKLDIGERLSLFPSFASNDNLLYMPAATVAPNLTSGYLDDFGVSYMLADGTYVNLFYGIYNGPDEVYNIYLGTDPAGSVAVDNDLSNLTASAVTPEPPSLFLFGAGLLMMLCLAPRWRRVLL